jgi:DNA modification methylase
MKINKVYEGNCMDLFKELDNESIDSVITSPPYWQLRDYKWEGQWGLEPTFQLYLEHLWQMMDEVYRVLKPTGTAWINLGDTYGSFRGKSGNHADSFERNGVANKDIVSVKQVINRPDKGMFEKCLLLIPHRFGIGCIDRGWIMRNDIIWAKRNGMPESVTDRFSKKHEYFFLMVKQEKYYFDLDGIRDKLKAVSIERYKYEFTGQEGGDSNNFKGDKSHLIPTTKYPQDQAEMFGSPRARQHRKGVQPKRDYENGLNGYNQQQRGGINEEGKNPGDVSDFWDIPTQPSSDEHYAAYNDKLIGKPIVAGCPEGGIILDPFCGTATTGCRALELDRNFIGFEGSAKYVKMANRNLLPYLQQQKLF